MEVKEKTVKEKAYAPKETYKKVTTQATNWWNVVKQMITEIQVDII